jgi:hypothetical protein
MERVRLWPVGLTHRLRPPYVSDKGYAQAAQDEIDDTV